MREWEKVQWSCVEEEQFYRIIAEAAVRMAQEEKDARTELQKAS